MRRLGPFPLSVAIALAAVMAGFHLAPAAAQGDRRQRTMFVSAVDKNGAPVEGLGPDAFVIREDNARREVLRVSKATDPIDIALLVDNSTAAADEITFFRTGLAKFVDRMAPGNHVALITIAERPTIAVEYTDDAVRLRDGVGRLFSTPQSGMTLLDGITETVNGMQRREASRAVVVPVLTDGVEFTNRYFRDVVATLVKARVVMHAVTIGQFFHDDEHASRERAFLLDAGPRDSGGQRITLLSAHGLEPALEKLAKELLSQYKVVYSRPESLIPPEKVSVSSGRPGVTMRGAQARGETGA